MEIVGCQLPTQTSAQSVARYLLWLAAHENAEDPDFLTPLKLQKLLYFVQAWTLVEWGKPMFHETIEAWRNGPVVPEVYKQYDQFGGRTINPAEGSPDAGLSDAERSLIHSVWDSYKQFSAYALSDLTHTEEPYLEAYRPTDQHGRCNEPIPADRITRSFSARVPSAFTKLSARHDRLRGLAERNARSWTGRPAA